MDFISQWWPGILLFLYIFDKEAAILTAALFASAQITGWIETTVLLSTGAITTNAFLFQQGVSQRSKFCAMDLRTKRLADKITYWLSHFGTFLTVLLVQIAFDRNIIRIFAYQTNTPKQTFLLCLAVNIFWISICVCSLTIIGQWLINEFSTLIKIRNTLPGLTLLTIITTTVVKVALLRSIFHYQRRIK